MPIIKSAKKRVRTARRAAARNVKTKRQLKSALKTFQAAVTSGGTKVSEAQSKAQSALAKAGKKNVMHKNKIARKQRQLAKAAKAAGAKVQKTAKKAVPAQTSEKKVSAGKPKKTTAKKTTPKKTTKK